MPKVWRSIDGGLFSKDASISKPGREMNLENTRRFWRGKIVLLESRTE
jgi:hypothetical protein